MFVRGFSLLEREHTVDRGLDPMYFDRTVHDLEHFARADGEAIQAG